MTIINSEFVTSTLDPSSYLAYHGGGETLEINLIRSWQCMGNTSKISVCSLGDGNELKPLVDSLANSVVNSLEKPKATP